MPGGFVANDVRKPPIGARLRLHKQGVRGWCGWCGKVCKDKTPGKGLLKWYHDKCSWEMDIISRPDSARRAVLERDKGRCIDCGEDWSLMSIFRPEFPVPAEWATGERVSPGPKPGTFCQVSQQCYDWHARERDREFYPYVSLTVISLWHVDHKTPLWKVAHMPDLERLQYFMLDNLITRCHRCHQRKTTEEAAERAKFNRLSTDQPAKPRSKWATRKMKSGNRFPPPGSRPMRRK